MLCQLSADFVNAYTLLFCAIALLWYYSRSTFGRWKKLNVKFKEPVAFFGNLAPFIFLRTEFHEIFDELYDYFGDEPYGGIFQMREPALLVKDPELVNDILVKDFKHFHDHGIDMIFFPDKKLNPMTENLFFSEGDRWRALRQKMSPVFTPGKLKSMYEPIFDCMTLMKAYLEAGMVADATDVNAIELFERLTIDVIGVCAFGLDCNSLKSNDEFRKRGVDVLKPTVIASMRMLAGAISKKLPILLKLPDFPVKTVQFFKKIVLDAIHHRRTNNVSRNDILELLMGLQNTSIDPKFAVPDQTTKLLLNEEFDEIDVVANAFVFFVGGFETTSKTLSYALYEIAMNQDIQDRLRTEIEQVVQKHGKIDSESLKEMTYLEAIISETLRKYPVIPVLFRKCTEDYVFSSTQLRLEKGTKILIPTYSLHHDWRYYPNPQVFDPERFNDENKQKRPAGTYVPFGEGPRYCIGARFAKMEIKIALTHLLNEYNITPCAETEIPLTFKKGSFVMAPKNGIRINMSKRKTQNH